METQLLLGDCLDQLKNIKDNSVDSIVTDPPYGLSFMGKKWDYDVPSTQIWEECIRVLKPGGHLLSFAGSRTYHRMAVRIEDAGFEIRDQIMWVYGSGFPKSHNIGKAVDKIEGNDRAVVGSNPNHRELRETNTMCGEPHSGDGNVTKGQSEWEGWGTALKPAHEPIVMARKPFKGTVADNVLEWGTGGINIDDCRIETTDNLNGGGYGGNNVGVATYALGDGRKTLPTNKLTKDDYTQPEGRFPANIIFDEEAGKILDEQSGITYSGPTNQKVKYGGGVFGGGNGKVYAANSGGASRFFYCPKANKKDRDEGCDAFEEKEVMRNFLSKNEPLYDKNGNLVNAPIKHKNIHPTVKPTDLMQYLIRLVTKKGGVVLDPFMGSGSTGKAAIKEGMIFVGIEREAEYFEIAKQRIKNELDNNEPKHNFW